MKRVFFILITLLINTSIFAQTTETEYNFLTKDFAAQTAKGIVPELEGYYLEDLLVLSDKTGKVRLLYKNDQETIVPVATQFHIYDGDKTFYICVPHEKSEKAIFASYSEDLQNIFKISTNAQTSFSVIMIQYPIELQKYYDEIKELEQAYAMQNELEDKGSNVTSEEKLSVKNTEKRATPKKDKPVIVKKTPKESLVINEYESKDNIKATNGKAIQKITGGLSRRKITRRPAVYNENSETGLVKVSVCVDNRGKVVKTTVSKSSSSKNEKLRAAAVDFAKQYKFNPSSQSRQCGYITIEFK
ncbi:MAG: TonB family protein [Saprospiraceae bacterium]